MRHSCHAALSLKALLLLLLLVAVCYRSLKIASAGQYIENSSTLSVQSRRVLAVLASSVVLSHDWRLMSVVSCYFAAESASFVSKPFCLLFFAQRQR